MSDRRRKPANRPTEPGPVIAYGEFTKSPEFMLLSSMIRWNQSIDEVLTVLPRAESLVPHFQARELFAAIVHLHEAGRRIDAATLAEECKRRGIIEDLGGYQVFVDLWEAQPTGANAVWFAERCRDRSLRWQLAVIANQLAGDTALPDEPAEQILDRYERQLQSIGVGMVASEAATLQTILAEAAVQIDALKTGSRERGIPTGYPDLDAIISGFQDGELMLVAARPGVGKTTFACNLLRNVCLSGTPALLVSLEQARVEIASRMLCAHARIDSHRVRTGSLNSSDLTRLADASDELHKAALFISDSPAQNISRIAATARRLKRQHGLALLVIDYLQLIEPDDRRIPRHEQVAAVSRRLKIVARELCLPVVALCQVNRGSEDRADGRPRLSDLRESGALEADADTVLLLHQPRSEDSGAMQRLVVDVAKQRNGPTDEMALVFFKAFGRFESCAIGM